MRPPPRLSLPPRKSSDASSQAAVEQLLASADQAIAEQHYGRAAALIERAIRVAPNDARAYFGLAQVHYYQSRQALSRSFLDRARALAVGDRALLKLINEFSARTSGQSYP